MFTPRLVLGLAAVPLLMTAPASTVAQSEETEPSSYYEGQQADVAEQEGAVFGRVRHLEGEISLRRDDEITTDLVVNDPITPGDVLTTGSGGRIEVQLADGSILRLDEGSELILVSLADGSSQIENTTILQLGTGSLIVRAQEMDSNEKRFQIDTDNASVFLLSDGQFRIDVRDDGTTYVASRRGAAEVMAQEVSTIVRSGERSTVRPGRMPGDPVVFNTRLTDDFDIWSGDRDDAMVRRNRVDDEEPAGLPEPIEPYTSELSYYGHWHHNPSYGWVWRPVGIVSDWQPYLYGRWVPCRSGLVWVSYEPWGWAPFHYGRWEFLVGSGWVWIPGYVFSGAHVAWGIAPGGYLGWCARGYYDYPVAFGYGIRHDPWVYVQVNNIFVRRVNTVVIRDVTIIREIEKKRVVVARGPRLDPRRIKDNPREVDEFYDRAKNRPGLRQVDSAPGARRMPFREHERQRLVEMNERKIKGDQKGAVPVTRGHGGRPVTVQPTERRVTVPPSQRTPQNARPSRPATGAGHQPRAREAEPKTRPPAAQRGGGAARTPRQQTSTGEEPAPRGNPRLREDSAPERVIPKILPRPKSDEKPGERPPQAAPRQQGPPAQRRPAEVAPRQHRPPAEGRSPQASPRQQQPPAQGRPAPAPPRNQGNSGGSKDKKGGEKKNKG